MVDTCAGSLTAVSPSEELSESVPGNGTIQRGYR